MINRDSLINYYRTLNNLFEEELKNEKIQTITFSSLRTIYSTLAYTYFAVLIGIIFAYLGSHIFVIHSLFYFHLFTNYILPVSRGVGWFWPIPDNFLYHLHLFCEAGIVRNTHNQHQDVRCRECFWLLCLTVLLNNTRHDLRSHESFVHWEILRYPENMRAKTSEATAMSQYVGTRLWTHRLLAYCQCHASLRWCTT